VDEIVHISELQFYRGADVIVAHHSREVGHDAHSAFEAAPMVVRHFENEEFIENIALNWHSYYLTFCLQGAAQILPISIAEPQTT
jgi:hypothetical protein